MDKIWYRNPSKSEVIGRCGGDEKFKCQCKGIVHRVCILYTKWVYCTKSGYIVQRVDILYI